jgi:hypothetical protein
VSIRCRIQVFIVPLPINCLLYTFQSSGLSIVISQNLSNLPWVIHAMAPSSTSFHHPDNTWQVVHAIKLPITQILATSRFILLRRSKYSPQTASVCVSDIISRPHKARSKATAVRIFTFAGLGTRQGDKDSALSHHKQSVPNLLTIATCIR